MITVKVSRWFRGRFSSRFIFDRVFDYVFERDSEYSTAAIFCQKQGQKLCFALVWTSGVTCLISKVAFQCPQLAVRKLNQKNAAIKVENSSVSKRVSKREPRNDLETFTAIVRNGKRLSVAFSRAPRQ